MISFVNDNEYESFQTSNFIEMYRKQMSIRKYPETKLVNLNTIYMDFETAYKENKYGLQR